MAATGIQGAVTTLQRVGFGEYEARAYVALLRKPNLNGYEVAKESGVPRANIYSILRKLVERGALLTVTGKGGPRYTPVDPRTLLGRIESEQRSAIVATRDSLASLETSAQSDEVLTARGYSALVDHARSALDDATRDVVLALFPSEAAQLEKEIASAEERGVAVTVLCLNACPADCGFCLGHAYRYRVAPVGNARWFLSVADGEALVAGQIDASGATALLTRQPMLVELTGAYIRQSIALASIIEDLGPELQRPLKSRTRKILASVSPVSNRNFIDYMDHLMSHAQPS